VQTWTSGAKDVVTTALTGRVWVTVGQGIVNEVYWPSADQPQVKDFGFLVVGPPGWREVKRVGRYKVRPAADPMVPLPVVVHTGDFYELTLTVVPDPDHAAVLVGFDLVGTGAGEGRELRLLPLLAPHLGRSTVTPDAEVPGLGADNVAWVDGDVLFARDGAGKRFLALAAAGGFGRGVAGYVGSSDGWTDLFEHGAMTWTYDLAGPGVIALTGELVAPAGRLSGVLALGFGVSADAAHAAATGSLASGLDAARTAVTGQWMDWGDGLTLPDTGVGLSQAAAGAVRQSAGVLKVNEDRDTAGAIVAGLAVPWGDTTNDPGGYHMVWCRDSCETALALAAVGDTATGVRLLEYLAGLQDPATGSWARCYFLDATPMPGAVQLDEVAFPVLLAAKLAELGVVLPAAVSAMVVAAAGCLARSGPVTGVDRWEETFGGSPFTIGLQVAALVAASGYCERPERDYLLALADDWNARLEQFTYVQDGILDRAFGTAGHYVRIGGPTDRLRLSNAPARTDDVAAELMIGLDFLYLVRLGLRAPDDGRITDTVIVVDRMIAHEAPPGRVFYRYDLDGYGEWLDGSGWPVRGFGIGRPWPLLAGERGHYELLAGSDAAPYLDTMLALRGPGGLLPEQVWDTNPLPWRDLYPNHPSGSAMPLAWAHSELIKLAVTMTTGWGRPLERLAVVEERYPGAVAPVTRLRHWRTNAPASSLPVDCDLVVEDAAPFTLHYGFDGWTPHSVDERVAEPLAFGMAGVRFTAAELAGHTSVQFVRRYNDGTWESPDHTVALGAPADQTGALRVPHRVTAAGLE
jgi:glucoamylase